MDMLPIKVYKNRIKRNTAEVTGTENSNRKKQVYIETN